MGQIQLSFLGTFQAIVNGKPITNWRSVNIQGLLAYLALTPQKAYPREVLADLFWPDKPEAVAKRNLRQALHRLRRLLEDKTVKKESYLLITRTTVQFNPASDASLDVSSFLAALAAKDLETAVALYQGDLLPGFACDSPPFEAWLRQERERLHRLALEALFKQTAYHLEQADYQTAQNLARQQLALEPWREEAHRQLIQTLFLIGERSASLAQVDICRQVLKDELGVDLSAETEILLTQIEAAGPTQQTWRNTNDANTQRLNIPFVGRKPEFERLVKAYRQVAGDGLQVVTLSGKAGIGKTRLAQEFTKWAALQGADVLYGRSFETSAGLSYQPLTHLLRQRLERENAPEDLLSDLWLSQLTRLLPELRDRYPDLPQPTQEENSARQHLFEAITRLVQALGVRKPVVLFIDDWQWADAASLDVLHYAAVRWAEEKTPLLLLLTLRQEAVNTLHPLQKNWLTHLKRHVNTSQLTLSELSSSETQHLVQGLFGSAAENQPAWTHFNKWLFAETEGQPLFLTETLKALVAEGLVKLNETATAWRIDEAAMNAQTVSGRIWHGVHEIIEGWLVQISDAAREVLTAVSILEQKASFDHICRVTNLEELQAIEVLDELLGKQLLLEADEPSPMLGMATIYMFAHQKVSEFIYARAGTARRRLLHRRAFVSLQTQNAQAAACAHHAQKGELLSETIRYSLIAGNEALALFAVQVALTHYETAWQIVEQSGWPEAIPGADKQALYSGLGRAYELTEAWTRAKETYEEMIADAQNIGVETMECLGLNRLANVYNLGLFNPEQAIILLERAHKLAEKNSDLSRLAETERNLSRTASFMSNPDKALKHAEQATVLARKLNHSQLLADCLYGLAFVHVPRGQWEKVELYAAEARKLFLEKGNLILAADCQRMMGGCQLHTGRPQESLSTLEETLLFSQQVENYWGQAEAARFLSRVHLELGNYGQAIAMGTEGVKQARQVSHPIVIFAQFSLGQVYRTIMALNLARPTLLEVTEKSTEAGFDPFPDQALSELCAIYALAGEWEQAYVYARKVCRIHAGSPWLPIGFTSWYETETLLRGGDGELARAEVERVAAVVGSNRRYQLPLLRSQAVLAQWDGDEVQAVTQLENALTLAQEICLPGEEWPILGELGKLYGELGEDEKAKQAYGEAGVIIHRLAETIDDGDLREGFLTAVTVQAILEQSKPV